jgi:hypothetical protein
LQLEISQLQIRQAELLRHLCDVHEHKHFLQQVTSETEKQHDLDSYEHGLAIYGLDAERESSEYDPAIAMLALVSSHQEEQRQSLSRLKNTRKNVVNAQELLGTVLASVEELRQEVPQKTTQLSLNDNEIAKLLQEQEGTVTEFHRFE